jgi:hypothetical protein
MRHLLPCLVFVPQLTVLLALSATASSCARKDSNKVVYRSGLPQSVMLAVGDRIEIALPSYAGSGNHWSIVSIAGAGVARAAVEPADAPVSPPAPGNGNVEPPALVLVPEHVVVSGLRPGEATWRLVLARPFGDATPMVVQDLHVTVVAARRDVAPRS